ncbi:hypothetical protein EXIGLDRAFT_719417 [Exidia glandulosa HHB12029]|uniref:Uncharacterized protein n=1 Tax=Exidia glandulosa HHB12029 TaxID=1314781 RepID=A0A165H2D7_EXIGL|nr:hypothetical protein EXIGLDRAFT_719417 [Exidia glandulosa HHB12029]
MRASFFTALFATVFFVGSAAAAPLQSRQVGNLQCNLARLRIVGALASTTGTVEKISDATADDDVTASAADDALTGLDGASSGIKTIALALVSGQTAPADARDQVEAGLTQAKTALDSISSTDDAVTAQVTKAQKSLDKAISAGQDVVAECK